MSSWTIGDVRITKVPQMTWHVPLWGFVPEATGPACAEVAPGLVDDDGSTDLSLHGLVVESGGRTILVDTCAGDDPASVEILDLIRRHGSITDHHRTVRHAVEAAGWAADDIDTVVCTHLHFDHVGGNLDAGAPAFPAARYLTAGDEWEHWGATPAGEDSTYVTVGHSVRPLLDAGALDLVDPDLDLTDDVRLVPTPGHTPGHVSVEIGSGGQTAVITGDLVHHPVELLVPEWTMNADVDPQQAVATRKAFVDRYGDGEALILGTHFGGSSAGRLDASTATWTPTP